MSGIRAKGKGGRLVLDEPTSLPEGTVLDLVVEDEGDDLTAAERQCLHEAIRQSWESVRAGRVRPAIAIVEELRARSK
jgi:hypothetical protein